MKDFVIKDFQRFIEIADTISTPFKFVNVDDSDVGEDYKHLEARVWLRTAYLTWEADVQEKEVKATVENLKRHGFTEAEIRETAIPVK